MLNFLRSRAQSLVVKLFLGLLILSFGVWGIADFIGGGSQSQVIARVGDSKITVPQFERALTQEMQRFSQQLGTTLTHEQAQRFNLHSLVLSRMIAETVLNEDAKTLKLKASTASLRDSILNNPGFQDADGNFSAANLARFLQSSGMSEQGFLNAQRDLVLRRVIAQSVTGDVGLPLTAVNMIERFLEEERAVSYVLMHIDDFEFDVSVSEDEISDLYESTKETRKSVETRDFDVAVLDYASIKDGLDIPEIEIERRASLIAAQAQGDEKRDILQFVFQNADDAAKALADLRGGAKVDEVISTYGLDASAVELGALTREDLVSPLLGDTAFALDAGGFSDVLDGPFGQTIIGVREIVESDQAEIDMDTAKAQARDQIASERIISLVRDLERDIDDARLDGKDGKAIAEQFALIFLPFRDVARDASLSDIAEGVSVEDSAEILARVFDTEFGLDVPIVRTNDASYFITLTNVKEAAIQPLDVVRDEVRAEIEINKRREALEQVALERLSALTSGAKTLNDFIAVDDQVQQADITRGTQDAPFNVSLISRLFETPEGGFAADVGADENTYFLGRVDTVTRPEPLTSIEDANEDVMADEVADISNDLLGQYIIARQNDLDYKIDNEALNSVLARLRGDR